MNITGKFVVTFLIDRCDLSHIGADNDLRSVRNVCLNERHRYGPAQLSVKTEAMTVDKPSSRLNGHLDTVTVERVRFSLFKITCNVTGTFCGAYRSLFGGDFKITPDACAFVSSTIFHGAYSKYACLRTVAWDEYSNYVAVKGVENIDSLDLLYKKVLYRTFGRKLRIIELKSGSMSKAFELFPPEYGWEIVPISHGGVAKLLAVR